MNISFADTDTRGGYVSGELTWWLPDYLADVAGWAAVLIEALACNLAKKTTLKLCARKHMCLPHSEDVEDLSDARTIATVDDVNVETVKIGRPHCKRTCAGTELFVEPTIGACLD
eukprot:1192942-Amphidinium_carterae.1